MLDPVQYTILGANKAFIDSFGPADRDTIIGKGFYELTGDRLSPGFSHLLLDPFKAAIGAGTHSTVESIQYDRQGRRRHIETLTVPLIGQRGKVSRIIHLSRDITERKRTEEQKEILADISRLITSTLDIREVYEQFSAEVKKLISFDSLAINLYDHQTTTMSAAYVSGRDIDGRRQGDPLALDGTLSKSVIDNRTSICIQSGDIQDTLGRFPRLSNVLKAGLRSIICVPLIYRNQVIGVMHIRSKEPSAYTEQDVSLAERVSEQITGTIANAQLYAGLKKAQRELEESEMRYRKLSIIDELTQLYNARHFYYQLRIETDRSNRFQQPLTLMLMDLDNFKAFNDTYGHVEGDKVLSRLGQVIKRSLRVTDFAYRYGGDEFTILLPFTRPKPGVNVAQRIQAEFDREAFTPVSGQEVRMTMSIGIAQYKLQEDMKAFVHRVDKFMYQAKRSGKNSICCESKRHTPRQRDRTVR